MGSTAVAAARPSATIAISSAPSRAWASVTPGPLVGAGCAERDGADGEVDARFADPLLARRGQRDAARRQVAVAGLEPPQQVVELVHPDELQRPSRLLCAVLPALVGEGGGL